MREHPFLSRLENRLYYLAAWLVIAAIHMLILRLLVGQPWFVSVVDSLVSNLTFAAIALSFWHPCRFISLEKYQPLVALLNHLVAATLASLIWLGIADQILTAGFFPQDNYVQFFESTLPWRFTQGILLYFVVSSIYYIHIYYQNTHQQLRRQAELQTQLREAELQALKYQINPHFLYNSLNSINALIYASTDAASEMTIRLSEYLRLTLRTADVPTRALAEEVRSLELYLEIERTRFSDRLQPDIAVSTESLSAQVPTMLLQPLVENAIKHGLNQTTGSFHLRLVANTTESFLNLSVENNFTAEETGEPGSGIGLQNVRQRLSTIYGAEARMRISRSDGIFRVIMEIPLRSEP